MLAKEFDEDYEWKKEAREEESYRIDQIAGEVVGRVYQSSLITASEFRESQSPFPSAHMEKCSTINALDKYAIARFPVGKRRGTSLLTS